MTDNLNTILELRKIVRRYEKKREKMEYGGMFVQSNYVDNSCYFSPCQEEQKRSKRFSARLFEILKMCVLLSNTFVHKVTDIVIV